MREFYSQCSTTEPVPCVLQPDHILSCVVFHPVDGTNQPKTQIRVVLLHTLSVYTYLFDMMSGTVSQFLQPEEVGFGPRFGRSLWWWLCLVVIVLVVVVFGHGQCPSKPCFLDLLVVGCLVRPIRSIVVEGSGGVLVRGSSSYSSL